MKKSLISFLLIAAFLVFLPSTARAGGAANVITNVLNTVTNAVIGAIEYGIGYPLDALGIDTGLVEDANCRWYNISDDPLNISNCGGSSNSSSGGKNPGEDNGNGGNSASCDACGSGADSRYKWCTGGSYGDGQSVYFAECDICSDTSWEPPPFLFCMGVSFFQASNCGNTRLAWGGKPCCTASCGDCSASCGGGLQSCTRDDCNTYYQTCNTQACPPSCTVSCDACSVSCGGGTQTCIAADCSTYTLACNPQACSNVDWKEVAP